MSHINTWLRCTTVILEANMPDLVQQLIKGNRTAFDQVYQRHSDRIFSFLLRMTGHKSVAEDLSQETWIRLARHASRLRADTHIRGWLFTVARNLAHSYHRKKRLLSFGLDSEVIDIYSENQNSLLDQAIAREELRSLEMKIAKLPIKYREILLLVGVEGLTTVEAADVLAIKPDLARQRLSRARKLTFRNGSSNTIRATHKEI